MPGSILRPHRCAFTFLLLKESVPSEVINVSLFVYDKITLKLKMLTKEDKTLIKLECGPMPNLMVALPNTGGALCPTPQSLADAHY